MQLMTPRAVDECCWCICRLRWDLHERSAVYFLSVLGPVHALRPQADRVLYRRRAASGPLGLRAGACAVPAGCFVSSIGGVLLVNRAVRRSGKASLLVMILAAIIGVGAVLTGVFGGRKAIEALERGEIGFHSFCSA